MRTYKECVRYAEKRMQEDNYMVFSREEFDATQIEFYISGVCRDAFYEIEGDMIYVMCSDTAKRKFFENKKG